MNISATKKRVISAFYFSIFPRFVMVVYDLILTYFPCCHFHLVGCHSMKQCWLVLPVDFNVPFCHYLLSCSMIHHYFQLFPTLSSSPFGHPLGTFCTILSSPVCLLMIIAQYLCILKNFTIISFVCQYVLCNGTFYQWM